MEDACDANWTILLAIPYTVKNITRSIEIGLKILGYL
jgi:hypothetical protein